jgi:hypothetical protein
VRVIKTAAVLSITALALFGCTTLSPQALDSEPLETSSETSLPQESTSSSAETETEPTEAGEQETSGEQSYEEELGELTDVDVLLAALMGPDGEYAALASYQAVLDEYGQVEPYATILQAESRHADALIRQLERLGVEVPENPYLGEIAAPADLQTAAEAWAEGEILNVELYDYLITQTDNSQILKVLGNLRRASLESHLPAFQAAAENGGTLESMPEGEHSN